MKSQVPESRAVKMLREVFESGRPLTYLRCTEEQRAARVLGEVSRRLSNSISILPEPRLPLLIFRPDTDICARDVPGPRKSQVI